MRNKFIKYDDPGHGWLKVKRSELKELGIEKLISSYSYQRGDDIFLEEDGDMSTFINAWENITNKEFNCSTQIKVITGDKNSKIRNYNCYINYSDSELLEIENLKSRMLNYANWSNKNTIYNASLDDLKFWQTKYSF
jgi:hypothetical protein